LGQDSHVHSASQEPPTEPEPPAIEAISYQNAEPEPPASRKAVPDAAPAKPQEDRLVPREPSSKRKRPAASLPPEREDDGLADIEARLIQEAELDRILASVMDHSTTIEAPEPAEPPALDQEPVQAGRETAQDDRAETAEAAESSHLVDDIDEILSSSTGPDGTGETPDLDGLPEDESDQGETAAAPGIKAAADLSDAFDIQRFDLQEGDDAMDNQHDTSSPFIIIKGRIVENPYYKFRRTALPASAGTEKQDEPEARKGRNPGMRQQGKPSFNAREQGTPESVPPEADEDQENPPSSPDARRAEPGRDQARTSGVNKPRKPQSHPPNRNSADEGKEFEKVDMKLGNVQLKLFKQDEKEKSQ
jgi:hypothetical protein